jgi:hypothetical protein
MMETLAFIGSDKNAGKTTVFNFVYQKMHAANTLVCLTSIGINGEPVDTYEGHPKPKITVYKHSFFITAGEHLKPHTGKYETVHLFLPPRFSKPYVLAKSILDMEMKGLIGKVLPSGLLLVDGSIDRQFLAHPSVCDGFYFAVLASSRKQQFRKANDFLTALALPVCPKDLRGDIEEFQTQETKSLLLGDSPGPIYHGRQIPFLDETLREAVKRQKGEECVLYLNGALSKSLFSLLSPFSTLTVVLDNFTLYQNVSVDAGLGRSFRPRLFLFHPVKVKSIFLNVEGEDHRSRLEIPPHIPVHNLYREDLHEIGV